jgi:hypothetical protein
MSTDAPKSPKHRAATLRSAAVLALLALVAAAVVLAQTSAGRTLLRRAHISQPPMGFVQLSFRDAGALPDYTVSAHGRKRIVFELTNNEHDARSLRWTIATRGDRPAASGTLRLKAGETKTLRRTVRIRCTRRRVYEIVRLADPSESIGYWMSCPSRHAASIGRTGTRG